MDVFLDILIDALIDTAYLIPFVLLLFILLEVLEHNANFAKKSAKLLNGKMAVPIGTALGIVPQCGFSVMASKLYANNNIKLGTLFAIFIATSDEAISVLMFSSNGLQKLLPLLLAKIAYALVAGFLINLVLIKKQVNKSVKTDSLVCECGHNTHHHSHLEEKNKDSQNDLEWVHDHDHNNCNHNHGTKNLKLSKSYTAKLNLSHELGTDTLIDKKNNIDSSIDTGRSHNHQHDNNKKSKYNELFEHFLHALKHTSIIILYVFIVNMVFNTVLHFVGEDALSDFLQSNKFLQPLIASIVGLIPNCGASIMIAKSYGLGILNFGAAFAGLSVSVGVASMILFKENKNIKNSILIMLSLFVTSVVIGTVITLFI